MALYPGHSLLIGGVIRRIGVAEPPILADATLAVIEGSDRCQSSANL
jgi:hypothetical protein